MEPPAKPHGLSVGVSVRVGLDKESERTLRYASDDADSPVASTFRGAESHADQAFGEPTGSERSASSANQISEDASGSSVGSSGSGSTDSGAVAPSFSAGAGGSGDGQVFGVGDGSPADQDPSARFADTSSAIDDMDDAYDGLRKAVVEIERSAAALGWDHAATVYALVPTRELLAIEELPADVRAQLEAGWDGRDTTLTAVIQEDLPGQELEDTLARLGWPESVVGAAVATERVMVPPEVQAQAPEDPQEAVEFFASHPEHDEVRLVVGVLRTGESWCAVRARSHDNEDEVAVGVNLVPGLVEALYTTFLPAEERATGGCGCGGSGGCGCGGSGGCDSESGSDGCGGSGSGGCGCGH